MPMNTFLGIFFALQTIVLFVLLGRIGVTGGKRIIWCTIALIPFFWLIALIRVAYFSWPTELLLKATSDSNAPDAVEPSAAGPMLGV